MIYLSFAFLLLANALDEPCVQQGLKPPLLSSECEVGFHCEGFVKGNNDTYPVYCPPSPQCVLLRNFGDQCESQGKREPVICPEEYYCPDATTIKKCPKGHFCLYGTKEPTKCPFLSICPEGSARVAYFGGVLASLIAMSILIGFSIFYRLKMVQASPAVDYESSDLFNSTTASSPSGMTSKTEWVSRPPHIQCLSEGFRRARGHNKPLKIKLEGVRVYAPGRTQRLRKVRHIPVLQGVSCELCPGRVTAIMGPSGSGKSVLLNALLGRLPENWKQRGELSINGDNSANISRVYRRLMGFVPQADFLSRELTVYQNLYYATQLKLPKEWDNGVKEYFLSAILDTLQLMPQKNTPIGDEESRGISGGQRRRVSVGMELAAAPMALFLDEPTSGLDSSTALHLCNALAQIATDAGLTIAMIIHQPRIEIWEALDDVLFLSPGGRTIYQGPQKEAQAFFERQFGVVFSPDANPADVIVDAIAERGQELADKMAILSGQNSLNATMTDIRDFEANQQQSEEDASSLQFYGAGVLRQFVLFHNRALFKQLSDLRPFVVEIVVLILIAMVLGVSVRDYKPIGEYKKYKLISVTPVKSFMPQVFMYNCMALGVACATSGVNIFVNERSIYFREAASGVSRLAYYFANTLASFYRIIVSSLVFTTLFHLVPMLYCDYWLLFAAFFFLILNTNAMGSIFAMLLDERQAPLVASVAAIVIACFSGFIPFPVGLKYLSYSFWATELMQHAFYKPLEERFEEQYSEWGWLGDSNGLATGILILFAAALHTIAFLLMIFMKRDMQR